MPFFKRKKEEEKKEEKPEEIEEKEVVLPVGKDARAYQLIKEPLITEKSVDLAGQNKYVFKISAKANKTEIKKAIEKLYKVKVENIRIANVVGKKRRLGRFEGWKPGFKKAIVTLREGHTIEIIPH